MFYLYCKSLCKLRAIFALTALPILYSKFERHTNILYTIKAEINHSMKVAIRPKTSEGFPTELAKTEENHFVVLIESRMPLCPANRKLEISYL